MSNLIPEALQTQRILIEAELTPIQGTRFQPTGFPNLGAAEFRGPSGNQMMLVESAQSMANRLESAAWDDAQEDLVPTLHGLPYVSAMVKGRLTDSIREAHRINSPFLFYGIEAKLRSLADITSKKTGGDNTNNKESSGVDIRKLARAVFHFDPNSVLHGVFLEKLVGSARLTRIVSAFIEAEDVSPVESGGVKNDRVDPTGKQFGGASKGFGNVPFARTEFTAQKTIAYFNIDVALLRSYGLGSEAEELLIALALWKIVRFFENGLRLRTACDFKVKDISVTSPARWHLPSQTDLERCITERIKSCATAGLFAIPAKTIVTFPAAK